MKRLKKQERETDLGMVRGGINLSGSIRREGRMRHEFGAARFRVLAHRGRRAWSGRENTERICQFQDPSVEYSQAESGNLRS